LPDKGLRVIAAIAIQIARQAAERPHSAPQGPKGQSLVGASGL
jgi:hypothetical protein